jgi:hypothetical protein
VAGTVVPISTELLQTTRRTWEAAFTLRSGFGIFDADREIWTSGFLRDLEHLGSLPPGYVITVGGDVQGIVLFDALLRGNRTSSAAHVVYIQYLASAPWNRRTGGRDRRFRGAGYALLMQAVHESIRRGSPGRLAVDAFINSASFFKKYAFDCQGVDPGQPGRVYLELRPFAAFSLLTNAESATLKGIANALEQRATGSGGK